MPYAPPSPVESPVGHAGHRRSYSHMHISAPQANFTGTSTSASLGVLPRRKSVGSAPSAPPTPRKPTFQLGRDDDDDEEDESDSLDERPRHDIVDDDEDDRLRGLGLPPLRLKLKTSSFDTAPTLVPFPRSSPLASPNNSPAIPAYGLPLLQVPRPHQPYTKAPMARSFSDQPQSPSPSPPHGVRSAIDAPARAFRPSVSRTSSTPILLSNGKPLRSSLKSSSSSPNIPFPSQAVVPSIMWPDLHRDRHAVTSESGYHGQAEAAAAFQRTRSASAMPNLASAPTLSTASCEEADSEVPSLSSSTSSLTPSSTSSTPSSSPPLSPSLPPSPTTPYAYPHHVQHHHAPKNVHFPSQADNLATVRVFSKRARPASLSSLQPGVGGVFGGEETETETEGEGSAGPGNKLAAWGVYGGSAWGGQPTQQQQGYPFPKVGGSPLAGASEKTWCYALDTSRTSSVPMRGGGVTQGSGNVYLESVGFLRDGSAQQQPQRPLTLTGTVLVRNVTYQKTVAVRFTLDEWHTTSEVLAQYERSLAALPSHFYFEGGNRVCSPYALDAAAPSVDVGVKGWDRFRFKISLEDYASSESLENRTMWLVGRYSAGVPPSAAVTAQSTSSAAEGVEEKEVWWDNNGGGNYRLGFKREEQPYRRGVILSAPSAYPTLASKSPAQLSSSSPISTSTSFTSSPSFHHQVSAFQDPQHQQHQAALAQSTLARLRKLNLRNYAAPAAYSHPSNSASASTPTSTDSTPVQTPVSALGRDDDGAESMQRKGHDVEHNILSTSLGMGMSMEHGFPATLGPGPMSPTSTSPSDAHALAPAQASAHWPWDVQGNDKDDEKKEKDSEEADEGVERLLLDIKARSTAGAGLGPGSGSGKPLGSGALVPPQRRRHSHAQGYAQARFASSSSSSSSPSTSSSEREEGGDSGARSVTPMPGPATTTTTSPTGPALWDYRPGSPSSGPGSGPPNPFPASLTSSASTLMGSPLTSSPATTPTPNPTPGGPADDAVYQAFVRQWCFAQAPGPTVGTTLGGGGGGATSGAGGGSKPTTPGGRMGMRMDFGEGPRLVVG